MRLLLVAVGRLKAGPERDLLARYRARIEAVGRALGISGLDVIEIPEDRGRREDDRRAAEAAAILDRVGSAVLIAFDERGGSPTSDAFARRFAAWRDEGRPALVLAVGGPDGLDDAVRRRADWVVAFGALTLPHGLVRVLAAEQIYRSLTILAGHPYHRIGQTEP